MGKETKEKSKEVKSDKLGGKEAVETAEISSMRQFLTEQTWNPDMISPDFLSLFPWFVLKTLTQKSQRSRSVNTGIPAVRCRLQTQQLLMQVYRPVCCSLVALSSFFSGKMLCHCCWNRAKHVRLWFILQIKKTYPLKCTLSFCKVFFSF